MLRRTFVALAISAPLPVLAAKNRPIGDIVVELQAALLANKFERFEISYEPGTTSPFVMVAYPNA